VVLFLEKLRFVSVFHYDLQKGKRQDVRNEEDRIFINMLRFAYLWENLKSHACLPVILAYDNRNNSWCSLRTTYQCHSILLGFFLLKVLWYIHSKHPTLFITISGVTSDTTTNVLFITPGHMSGVRERARRNVVHPFL
jgi:hypothetical protein